MNRANKIDFFGDDDAHFVGDVPDTQKLARLNRLRELCRAIAESDDACGVRNPLLLPFDNHRRNALVFLEAEHTIALFDHSAKLFAAAASIADDVAITRVEESDTVRVSFGVRSIWREWHYDNDLEHGE